MQVELSKIILIALLLSGCGESVSERSANEVRDMVRKDRERTEKRIQQSSEHRLRSLEERVTEMEKR